ncbi:MAG: hypothetical protein U0165_18995 [Polyangiaceae bacterium]
MSSPQLQAGSIVAERYQIHGTLTVSASASTYTATATDGRGVVIKVFPPELAQRADLMAMLQQYNTAINALPESVAVRVLDAGYDDATGAPFVASEYVAWPSLATVVRQGVASLDRASLMLTALARALEPAHAMQMPHQSLRPTNVFVAPVGEAVKLTDFGTIVPRGAMFGADELGPALAFLAPEQLPLGSTASASADIFTSILVIFYAMTGVPFWRCCQNGTPSVDVWRAEVASPPRASERARELGVSLPKTLDPVFARALAAQPSDRYSSIGALAQAFYLAVQDQSVAAIPVAMFAPAPPSPASPSPASLAPPAPPAPEAASPRLGKKGTVMLGATSAADVIAAAQAAQAAQAASAPSAPSMAPAAASAAPYRAVTPAQAIPPPPSPDANTPFSPAPLPAIPEMDELGAPVTKKKNGALIAGLIAVPLFAAAAIGIWFVTHDAGATATPAGSSSPSTSASSASTPAVESAAPTATQKAPEVPTAVASATASAAPTAPSDRPNVTAHVRPPCDDIKVDGKSISGPIKLPPGPHRVSVAKGGFLPQNEQIKVVAGEPFVKEYKLKEPSAPIGPSKPNKPCGTFVNPCRLATRKLNRA